MNNTGKLVISLDFELLWGMRDKKTTETYGKNILGVVNALPKMIETFEKYNVKATFAIVGFLFALNKEELISFCPQEKPQYFKKDLSPYNGHFDLIKKNTESDKYHFASELINHIKKHPNQEIATHTFSHYYCLERGQTKENFKEDIVAAIKIARQKGIAIKSLVFPRNQFNETYLEVIKDLGITSYRGNEKIWFQNATTGEDERPIKRAFRLLDAYINLSGHNCYNFDDIKKQIPFNIPSSRFLRPYSPTLKYFENLRIKRILNSMTFAAKNKKIYHLWWHPHNFGSYQEENFKVLNKILNHYNLLKSNHGFESITMNEMSNLINSTRLTK